MTQDRVDVGWVLWAGTVGLNRPILERIEAAVAGGYDRLSVSPLDVVAVRQEGISVEGLGQAIHDAGLGVVVDPVMGWYSNEPAPGPYAALQLDDVLRMAETVGAAALTALGPFSPDEVPQSVLEERFAALCDRASDFGSRVQMEFMPFTVISDVQRAWSLVRAADRRNGGLVIDTWHFFRGNPDFRALESVPGDRVFSVQVADAAAEPVGSLGEDTFNRLLPGEGALDLLALLRTLAGMGALHWVGPEVISPRMEAMEPIAAARLAGERVRALVAEAQRP
jgi:sugar phosphate isomerase/epimerase